MRKIEQQMIQAIKDNKAWRSGNTEVTLGSDGVSYVFLHGNLIAEVDDTSITVYDGGWQSNTTKSRLNAICNAFCIVGEGIFQHKFEWFVRTSISHDDGSDKVFDTIPFVNGYTFA